MPAPDAPQPQAAPAFTWLNYWLTYVAAMRWYLTASLETAPQEARTAPAGIHLGRHAARATQPGSPLHVLPGNPGTCLVEFATAFRALVRALARGTGAREAREAFRAVGGRIIDVMRICLELDEATTYSVEAPVVEFIDYSNDMLVDAARHAHVDSFLAYTRLQALVCDVLAPAFERIAPSAGGRAAALASLAGSSAAR